LLDSNTENLQHVEKEKPPEGGFSYKAEKAN
jgi:hypothetical protein